MSEKKEQNTETPKVTEAAAENANPDSAPVKKKFDPKALIAAMKSKLPQFKKPKLAIPKPSEAKVVVIGFFKDLILLPVFIFRADWLTRIAVVGLAVGIYFLALSVPRGWHLMRLKFFHTAEQSEIAEEQSEEEEESTEADSDLVKAALYLGKFRENFHSSSQSDAADPAAFEVELFAECDSETSAEELKKHSADFKPVISAILKDVDVEQVRSEEGQNELQIRIEKALVEKYGSKIKNVVITSIELS